MNSLWVGSGKKLYQVEKAIHTMLDKTQKDAKEMFLNMLTGDIKNVSRQVPHYLRSLARSQAKYGGRNEKKIAGAAKKNVINRIAKLQSDLFTSLQELTTAQHALRVFITGGWGECTATSPLSLIHI